MALELSITVSVPFWTNFEEEKFKKVKAYLSKAGVLAVQVQISEHDTKSNSQ